MLRGTCGRPWPCTFWKGRRSSSSQKQDTGIHTHLPGACFRHCPNLMAKAAVPTDQKGSMTGQLEGPDSMRKPRLKDRNLDDCQLSQGVPLSGCPKFPKSTRMPPQVFRAHMALINVLYTTHCRSCWQLADAKGMPMRSLCIPK